MQPGIKALLTRAFLRVKVISIYEMIHMKIIFLQFHRLRTEGKYGLSIQNEAFQSKL